MTRWTQQHMRSAWTLALAVFMTLGLAVTLTPAAQAQPPSLCEDADPECVGECEDSQTEGCIPECTDVVTEGCLPLCSNGDCSRLCVRSGEGPIVCGICHFHPTILSQGHKKGDWILLVLPFAALEGHLGHGDINADFDTYPNGCPTL